jgi:hypothetical protein
MAYKYTHLIPQNTAPSGATSIGAYDGSGNKICSIALGRLTPPNKEKLYSFGVVSDIHLYKDGVAWITWNPNEKFDNALTYFENEGCAFCIVCGDLTQTGFYSRTNDSDPSTTYFDVTQFAKYKEICDNHTLPVYALMGNHESYYEMPITANLGLMEAYTGKGTLSYTIAQGDDLFIFLGQPSGSKPMSDEALQWLYETLETNRNKRCFVFVHPYIEEDSGDPLDLRENSIFDYWGIKTGVFMDVLRHYKNVVLFHGHSHMKFECQELDSAANYTAKNGFKSVHVPSLSRPRGINVADGTTPYKDAESQGYVVDVCDDFILLHGWDFINNKPLPLGTYKIDTPLQTIPAGTFIDSTGTIII